MTKGVNALILTASTQHGTTPINLNPSTCKIGSTVSLKQFLTLSTNLNFILVPATMCTEANVQMQFQVQPVPYMAGLLYKTEIWAGPLAPKTPLGY